MHPSIVWFRQDLRLEDNPALLAAIERKAPVIPVFIWSHHKESSWAASEASQCWARSSLTHLQKDLSEIALSLILRMGNAEKNLLVIISKTKASHLFWNRCYEPFAVKRDTSLKAKMKEMGIEVKSFKANLLFEPWEISNKQGNPFKVFTPFWRNCCSFLNLAPAIPDIKKASGIVISLNSESLNMLDSKSKYDFGVGSLWKTGAKNAKLIMEKFLEKWILSYLETRDRPDVDLTSHLSPYLHFGEISPKIILKKIAKRFSYSDPNISGFVRQLGWRELAYHLLYHFPQTTDEPLREEFKEFSWLDDKLSLTSKKHFSLYPEENFFMKR